MSTGYIIRCHYSRSIAQRREMSIQTCKQFRVETMKFVVWNNFEVRKCLSESIVGSAKQSRACTMHSAIQELAKRENKGHLFWTSWSIIAAEKISIKGVVRSNFEVRKRLSKAIIGSARSTPRSPAACDCPRTRSSDTRTRRLPTERASTSRSRAPCGKSA